MKRPLNQKLLALCAALLALQRDPAAAAAMATRARARVQPFTYRARAAAILALAREVTDPSPLPAGSDPPLMRRG